MKNGSKITVKCKTSSKTEKRGLNVTNITPESGFFNSTSLDDQVNIGTVTEDGSITLTNTGGLYIYMISVAKRRRRNNTRTDNRPLRKPQQPK